MLTRPGKSEAEAEARCYEAEAKAENLALRPLEATMASRT